MTPRQTELLDHLDVDERARALGVKVYDTALPQDWVDKFTAGTDWNPVGHIVWSYDLAPFFGEPIAVDAEGQHHLHLFLRA